MGPIVCPLMQELHYDVGGSNLESMQRVTMHTSSGLKEIVERNLYRNFN